MLGAGLTKFFFWPFGPQYKGVPPLLSLSSRFFWEQKYVRECLIKILSHYFYLHLKLVSSASASHISPVAQCKILARSIQNGQKHQTLHGSSLGLVSQYWDRCPQLPLQDLQQLLAEVLQQPSMMGALC